jgi:hypothetical protein
VSDIEFTKKEYHLLNDYQFFDIKASITSKILNLFAHVEDRIRLGIKEKSYHFPEKIAATPGKISKGENYQNCPYIVLDYPRLYSREKIFAFRSIFWWGHYFSNAMIIGGHAYHQYIPRILEITGELKNRDWYLCVYRTPWKLENLPWNYVQFSHLTNEQIRGRLQKYPFIKIARIYALDHYKNLGRETVHFLSDLMNLIS